jgi:hypothetical protein
MIDVSGFFFLTFVETVLSGRNIKNHADLRQWKKGNTPAFALIAEDN